MKNPAALKTDRVFSYIGPGVESDRAIWLRADRLDSYQIKYL